MSSQRDFRQKLHTVYTHLTFKSLFAERDQPDLARSDFGVLQ